LSPACQPFDQVVSALVRPGQPVVSSYTTFRGGVRHGRYHRDSALSSTYSHYTGTAGGRLLLGSPRRPPRRQTTDIALRSAETLRTAEAANSGRASELFYRQQATPFTAPGGFSECSPPCVRALACYADCRFLIIGSVHHVLVYIYIRGGAAPCGRRIRCQLAGTMVAPRGTLQS
jgi:hypothetical protein